MTNAEFTGPSLTQPQWEQLKALATSLTPEQAVWLGGYFTGYADAGRNFRPQPQSVMAVPGRAADAVPAQRTLSVLYGSETGNASAMAEAVAATAAGLGLSVTARDMADYRAGDLKAEQDLLVIVSTCGEGDPPQPALGFFEFLAGRKAPRLDGVRYAVLALGDSTYEFYCEAGKRIDRRLEELGAQRVATRIDCDVDELKLGKAWAEKTLTLLLDRKADRPATASVAVAPAKAFGEAAPFLAPVLENIVLTGRGSSKQVRHLELDLEGSALTYEPGDALGIVARNEPRLVTTLMAQLQASEADPIEIEGRQYPFAAALETVFEIAALTPRFLARWAELSGATELADLSRPERASERKAFFEQHHIEDVLRLYPARGVAPQAFVTGLRKLQPRLYSIASSQRAQDGAAHLTVATVAYQLHASQRYGVVSGALSRLDDAEASLPVYIKPNPNFRLPADDVPIIMIGAGTGVAPYRAFIQERALRGALGKTWLVFGERNFRSDFLYQTEWQDHLKKGVLNRLDLAFSRDGENKTYVQHRLRDSARDVYAWLEEGAHIYVCGDANGMAPEVHGTLRDIIVNEGAKPIEAAEAQLRELGRQHRYSRDVY